MKIKSLNNWCICLTVLMATLLLLNGPQTIHADTLQNDAIGNTHAGNPAPESDATPDPKHLVLDLETTLTLALENNTDLKRSNLDVSSARLSLDSQKRNFHPDLSFSGSLSSRWSDPATPGGDSMTQNASMRLGSAYTLFNGFADSATRDAAREELAGAELTGERAVDGVLYLVASRFLSAAAAMEQIRVQEENVTAQQELLRKINAFYEAGRRPIVDLYQQQAEAASADYQLLAGQRDYELKKLALLNDIGVSPGLLIVDIDTRNLDALRAALSPPADVAQAMALAREQRPDYKAAIAVLAAAELDVRAARGGYWPELSLGMDAGTSWSDSLKTSWSDQFFQDSPYASVGLSIALPIYDRARTRNSVAAAELMRERNRLARMDLDLQIEQEVVAAYLEYETASKQLESTVTRISYTRQALDNFEQRYNLNAATLLEVIQARANHFSAAYEKIAAEYNLIDKAIAIFYAIGDLNCLTVHPRQ